MCAYTHGGTGHERTMSAGNAFFAVSQPFAYARCPFLFDHPSSFMMGTNRLVARFNQLDLGSFLGRVHFSGQR